MIADSWRLAVGTLTAVPVRPPTVVDRRRAGLAMVLAPVATVPLGAAAAITGYAGIRLDLPPPVVALLAVGVIVLGNRAFHVDGLADTVDGLASSYDRERALTVMKTGTSGPAGVVALVLVIGLQAAALASVLAGPHALRGAVLAGLGVCVSRAALVLCCAAGVPSARPGGLGDTYTQAVPRPVVALVWLAGAAVLALAASAAGLDWWRGVVAVAAAALAVAVLVAHAVRRLGGVTGDVFGAAVELALAALLVGLS
ncbi:adenosylcobinamide-GDP ribazoletransferase [Nocardioides sp. BP30]|uniref:adenosylcobinamide-GDP ribazoletransferase n=1 Tax=Nocardioides sp. BP30 TaxID=3036374 RepID=UPI002468C5C7|nr:adenosylcobinamide-GDP ribazoletransferase [Nocardioides sp. BP30]WGL51276.1 adenosylcobinamide-GDP ribazoletransferase [Nocardioides sp. BP30]